MPEGPEIRRVADELEQQLAGRYIDNIFFGLDALKQWQPRLTGARVSDIETFGKAMVIHLDTQAEGRMCIYSHNQLYGRWYFCDTGEYPETGRQLRLAIDCQGKSALLYSASDIAVISQSELAQHPFIKKLGPDVLKTSTTSQVIIERLKSKQFNKRQLGGVLTDQSFVAGLGNYLRCEILFYAGLHARTRSAELDERQLQLLADTIIALSRQSYRTAGITNELKYAQRLIEQGSSFEQARFYVFRRQGLACYRCEAPIEKQNLAGQACYFCPDCQRLPQSNKPESHKPGKSIC